LAVVLICEDKQSACALCVAESKSFSLIFEDFLIRKNGKAIQSL